MPIYEYRCQSCGHLHEALQKVSDTHLTDCPECNEAALKRLMSAPSFRLKGSGWYETDFKSDKERKRNLVAGEKAADGAKDAPAVDKKESKDAGKSSDSGSKESTSKPDAKSPSKGSGTEAA